MASARGGAHSAVKVFVAAEPSVVKEDEVLRSKSILPSLSLAPSVEKNFLQPQSLLVGEGVLRKAPLHLPSIVSSCFFLHC